MINVTQLNQWQKSELEYVYDEYVAKYSNNKTFCVKVSSKNQNISISKERLLYVIMENHFLQFIIKDNNIELEIHTPVFTQIIKVGSFSEFDTRNIKEEEIILLPFICSNDFNNIITSKLIKILQENFNSIHDAYIFSNKYIEHTKILNEMKEDIEFIKTFTEKIIEYRKVNNFDDGSADINDLPYSIIYYFYLVIQEHKILENLEHYSNVKQQENEWQVINIKYGCNKYIWYDNKTSFTVYVEEGHLYQIKKQGNVLIFNSEGRVVSFESRNNGIFLNILSQSFNVTKFKQLNLESIMNNIYSKISKLNKITTSSVGTSILLKGIEITDSIKINHLMNLIINF